MKITTKKIIAREFLFLIAVLVLALIAFLCTYPYNSYRQNKIEILTTEITAKQKNVDSLKWEKYRVKDSRDFNTMQKLYNNLVIDGYDLPEYTIFVNDMKDSVNRRKLHTNLLANNYDLLDFEEFTKEILNSLEERPPFKPVGVNPSTQNNTIDEINQLKTQKDEQSNLVLNFDEQIVFGIYSLIVLVILLFGLRYLFYAFRWSLKTLRQ